MWRLSFWLVTLASVAVAVYAVVGYAFLTPGRTVHPDMMVAYAAFPGRILVHVAASLVALAIGPFQFIPAIRRRRSLHRGLGMAYFVAVFVGGTSGFFTAFIAQGGPISVAGFIVLSLLWLGTAGLALRAVKRADYVAHEDWAIRNFALTFAAVTIRLQLGAGFAAGRSFEDFYWMLSWTCWIPNLLLAEWLIRRRRGRAHPA
jgi:uncharacterized membrane protein